MNNENNKTYKALTTDKYANIQHFILPDGQIINTSTILGKDYTDHVIKEFVESQHGTNTNYINKLEQNKHLGFFVAEVTEAGANYLLNKLEEVKEYTSKDLPSNKHTQIKFKDLSDVIREEINKPITFFAANSIEPGLQTIRTDKTKNITFLKKLNLIKERSQNPTYSFGDAYAFQ